VEQECLPECPLQVVPILMMDDGGSAVFSASVAGFGIGNSREKAMRSVASA